MNPQLFHKILSKSEVYSLFQKYFSDLSLSFLKSQYYNYADKGEIRRTADYLQYDNYKTLAESSTYTVPASQVQQKLYSLYLYSPKLIHAVNPTGYIECIELVPNIGQNIDIIKGTMLSLGWTVTAEGNVIIENMKWSIISFDPIFQENVADELKNAKYIFHIIPAKNISKIKELGLIPQESRNKLFKYPNRLHLLSGMSRLLDIFNIGKQLYLASKEPNNGKYILLAIKTDDLPEDFDIFYDPRYELGYYTKNDISPDIINVCGTVDYTIDNTIHQLKPFIPIKRWQ